MHCHTSLKLISEDFQTSNKNKVKLTGETRLQPQKGLLYLAKKAAAKDATKRRHVTPKPD